MREYACQETTLLIGRLSLAVKRAAGEADVESIHDVRVALRRLSRCLRAFAQFYPKGSAKKIRRRLKNLMAAAGTVRDCDVAIELAGLAGFDGRSALVRQLAMRRRRSGRNLLSELRRWEQCNLVRQWGKRLEL